LRICELNWKQAVEGLEKKEINADNKLVIACYVAYLRSCSFTAKRLGQSIVSANEFSGV
jgi:hypothetical protein